MPTCKDSECKKKSSYGKPGSKIPEYCKDHKPDEYVDVIHKMCISGCNIRASYGKPGSKIPEYCVQHKPEICVNVRIKKCLQSGCDKQPSYGKPGSKISEYCIYHKLEDYVDVKNKICVFPGCIVRSNYGKLGSKLAEYCATHKLDGYVNVITKTCRNDECCKLPIYGKVGNKIAEYCSEHKLEGYVNVKDKKCIHPGCSTRPIYGKVGKVAEYCSEHKLEGYVNVKDKKCIYPDCTTRAGFGYLFQSKTSCVKHRTPNMYTKNRPVCEGEKCKKTPNFTNKDDSYPLRCEDHKHDHDIQISESNCMICDQVLFIKSDSKMCNICAKVDITSIRHEKELKVKILLEESGIEFIHDRTSDSGCHKHRPDFLIDCDTHYIVIEVDENQHSSYTKECETSRMVNIQQGFGGMRVLFIRFNPDGYTDSSKKKIRAGITLTRTKRLISLIRSSILHPPPYLLSVVKLYYDGDDVTNIIAEIDVDNLFNTYADIIFETE